jgi:hypothetical protein
MTLGLQKCAALQQMSGTTAFITDSGGQNIPLNVIKNKKM